MNKVDFDIAIDAGGEVAFDPLAPEHNRHLQAEWVAGALSLTRQAITIKNAVIAGTLVLSELDIESSLRFFSCSFDRIDAGGATFQKIFALQDCTISAGASFTGCEFRRGISLINSKVKGQLSLANAHIALRCNLNGIIAESLMTLGLTVRGNVVLNQANIGSMACEQNAIDGNVSMTNTTIHGSCSFIGSSLRFLVADQANVQGNLAAERLTASGNVSLRDATVAGEVSFIGCTVGGRLDISGATFHKSFNVTGARVEILAAERATSFAGDFYGAYADFGAFEIMNGSFSGVVLIPDANIKRALTCSSATFAKNVHFDRTTIGGSVELRPAKDGLATSCNGDLSFAGSRVGGQLVAFNCKIAKDLRLAAIKVDNELVLNKAEVGGAIKADGAIIASIDARDLNVGGAGSFNRCNVVGGVNIRKARFNSSVSFDGSHLGVAFSCVGAQFQSNLSLQHATIAGRLDLSGAVVRGQLDLTQCQIGELCFQTVFQRDLAPDHAQITGILMAGTRYDRVRASWSWLSDELAIQDATGAEALFDFESMLRRTGYLRESESVYLKRRRAEARQLSGLRAAASVVLDVISGYGSDRVKISLYAIGIFLISIALCIWLPDFVSLKPDTCIKRVQVDWQTAISVGVHSFNPVEDDIGPRVRDCFVLGSVRASMIMLGLQGLAIIILPIFVATITGWLRAEKAHE